MVWFCIAHMCARCRIRVLFQGGRREVLVSVKRANTGKAAPADRKSHVSCVWEPACLHFTQVPGIMREGAPKYPTQPPVGTIKANQGGFCMLDPKHSSSARIA